MTMDEDRLHEERLEKFERLRNRIDRLMKEFGRPDFVSGPGDYGVIGDYWGYPQVKVGIHNLSLLQPHIIKRLQQLLADFPEWEIVMTVAVRGHYYDWPDMGLYLRRQHILDTLQRQFFPEEFQRLAYEGSRRGTEEEAIKRWVG
jgi:hypothetical protein